LNVACLNARGPVSTGRAIEDCNGTVRFGNGEGIRHGLRYGLRPLRDDDLDVPLSGYPRRRDRVLTDLSRGIVSKVISHQINSVGRLLITQCARAVAVMSLENDPV
jgi:hypothetical protein